MTGMPDQSSSPGRLVEAPGKGGARAVTPNDRHVTSRVRIGDLGTLWALQGECKRGAAGLHGEARHCPGRVAPDHGRRLPFEDPEKPRLWVQGRFGRDQDERAVAAEAKYTVTCGQSRD